MTATTTPHLKTTAGPRPVRAPRGTVLSCKGWQQEAALRMLMNNLDPDVAERPDDLVVYGGTGRAARSWDAFDAIVRSLRALEADETLLVQSGKPVGVFRTHTSAPRVLIANANLVGRWATWDHFRELERAGLMMYGQMTAGSWIYIGSQGILQGTYETFGAMARRHFGGTLAGRFVLTAGLGGMGGAQPLAATMHGAAILGIEVDEARIDKRLATGYCDRKAHTLDEALALIDDARRAGTALSVGLVGNAAEVLPELVARGVVPDVLTDQTSAHDTLNGYVPMGHSLAEAAALRSRDPKRYVELAEASIAVHVRAMLELQQRGAIAFDYGNNIRTVAFDRGVANAFDIPGFIPEYIRPLFCEGKGPFRWVALSGDPKDLHRTDELILDLFPDDEHLRRWITLARERVHFQGLPARICWLGQGERARFGVALNDLVAAGEISAPIVIGRDHLDTGSRGLPVPGDRAHEGRQRRRGRLADSERDAERGERRVVGVVPPRRRRGDRQLAARRPGDRRRRDAGDARTPRTRVDQRSGDRRRAARRRGIRGSDRDGAPGAHHASDAGRRRLSIRRHPCALGVHGVVPLADRARRDPLGC